MFIYVLDAWDILPSSVTHVRNSCVHFVRACHTHQGWNVGSEGRN